MNITHFGIKNTKTELPLVLILEHDIIQSGPVADIVEIEKTFSIDQWQEDSTPLDIWRVPTREIAQKCIDTSFKYDEQCITSNENPMRWFDDEIHEVCEIISTIEIK